MKKTTIAILLGISTLLTFANAQQQVYKWVDSKGIVHYTELAPEEQIKQQINSKEKQPKKPEKVSEFVSSTTILVPIQSKPIKSPKTLEQLARDKARASIKLVDTSLLSYCNIVELNLEAYERLENKSLDELYLVNKSGEQQLLTKEQAANYAEQSRDGAQKYCSNQNKR